MWQIETKSIKEIRYRKKGTSPKKNTIQTHQSKSLISTLHLCIVRWTHFGCVPDPWQTPARPRSLTVHFVHSEQRSCWHSHKSVTPTRFRADVRKCPPPLSSRARVYITNATGCQEKRGAHIASPHRARFNDYRPVHLRPLKICSSALYREISFISPLSAISSGQRPEGNVTFRK